MMITRKKMKPKVLLINPPFKYPKQIQIIPIALLNLGTALERNGIDVKIIDISAEKKYTHEFLPDPLKPEEFIQQVKKYDPDIIGLTSCTENYPITMRIARWCKEENENIKIIYGGIHATFQPLECLTDNSIIDLVVVGEAEHILPEAVSALNGAIDLNGISNIYYRENGLIKHSQSFTLPDLNKIPVFDIDLIKGKFYPSFLLLVEFGRGCPFNCSFCCLSPMTERKIRFFPIERIIENLSLYGERFKNFSFYISDPTFLLSLKRISQFVDEIRKRRIELKDWNFQTRINTLKKGILGELRSINAAGVTIGVEDIHDSVLKVIGKEQTFEQIERGLKILKELDYLIESNIIIGLPSQSKEHMLENIAYSDKLDICGCPCLTPFPGSQIFCHPEKFGLTFLSKDFESYTGKEIVTESDIFPFEQQREMRNLMWRHIAQVHLERESTYFFDRKNYERILEIGFEGWNEEWKQAHKLNWN